MGDGEGLKIRWAQPEDVTTILRFVRELAEFERAPDAVLASEQDFAHALFVECSVEAVIAELDGGPVGFAMFFHNFSTWEGRKGLYLEDLYVSPAARSKGVGTALLAHLARIALDRNCARFEWWVLDWNQQAIDVYRKIGAVGMDEWTVQRLEGQALRALAGR